MPGPAPDPNALRRNRRDDVAWTKLASEPREEPAPKFPLTRPSAREKRVWVDLWKRPQSDIWRRDQLELEVGMYVRTLVESEESGAPASLRTLLMRQAESLLLTTPAMHRAHVTIATDELAGRRDEMRTGPRRLTARERAQLADAPAV